LGWPLKQEGQDKLNIILKTCQDSDVILLALPEKSGLEMDRGQAVTVCTLPDYRIFVVAEKHEPGSAKKGS